MSAVSRQALADPEPRRPEAEAGRAFYRWGQDLADALVQTRARFGGDLDQALLYLVFALSELSHTRRGDGGPAGRGMNALSLAEITGIPRETARRKLLALVEAGRLRRAPDGLFHLDDGEGLGPCVSPLQDFFDLAPAVVPAVVPAPPCDHKATFQN